VALRYSLIAAACYLIVSFFACAEKEDERIAKLAEYLQAEQRLRQEIPDPIVRDDSIIALKIKYGFESDSQLRKLYHTPEDWLRLLRKLRRGP
jgi:hypothetical protein